MRLKVNEMTEIEALRTAVESMRASKDPIVVEALGTLDAAIVDVAAPVDPAPVVVPPQPAPDIHDPFICPQCGSAVGPIVSVRNIAVCGNCGATLYVAAGVIRLATIRDVDGFSNADFAELRRGRGSIVRPERRQR